MDIHRPFPKVVSADEGRRFDILGATMTYKATAEDTKGAYSLAVEVTPPGGGLPLHIHHREDEAMYILEGEYEIQMGEQRVRATAGTFVFLPRTTPNGYQNVGSKPGRFIHLTSPGGFEKLVEETSRITAGGPPDMRKVGETAHKFGIDFVRPSQGGSRA